jgi:hypothetical protein
MVVLGVILTGVPVIGISSNSVFTQEKRVKPAMKRTANTLIVDVWFIKLIFKWIRCG